MSTPRRWLESAGELSDLEREVLSAGAGELPPAGAKQAVRAAIAAASGAAAATGTTSAKAALGAGGATQATATSTATTLVFLKGLGLGLLLGTVVAGGITSFYSSRAGTSPPRVALSGQPAVRLAPSATLLREMMPQAPLAPSPEPTVESARATSSNVQHSTVPAPAPAPAPSDVVREPVRGSAVPSGAIAFPNLEPALPPVTPKPAPNTTALAESRAVAEARNLLRSGDPREALSRLQALQRDFPSGILNQERDALVIEALLAAGNSSEARERAKEFLSRYPKSPHAAAARRALLAP
jgi:Outer membrane lipoprotein